MSGSLHRFLSTADKVFKEAELAYALRDEERAYCLYMRYFNIITAIKKTDEFKKNEVCVTICKFCDLAECVSADLSLVGIEQLDVWDCTSWKRIPGRRKEGELQQSLETPPLNDGGGAGGAGGGVSYGNASHRKVVWASCDTLSLKQVFSPAVCVVST